MKRLLLLVLVLLPRQSLPYPLDGLMRSGIRRLEGEKNAQQDRKARKLPPGALGGVADVKLHLTAAGADWDLAGHQPDPLLAKALAAMIGPRDPSYGLMVIDFTDPGAIAWAGVREERSYYPGSVGKVITLAALFDGLRRGFPDVAAREKVLRETVIEATDWSQNDSHRVPHFDPASGRNLYRPIVRGERFTLAEWVDFMISSSANSAGATVWKEALLLGHFGAEYPVSREREEEFFKTTPRAALQEMAVAIGAAPLAAAGIDTAKVRQGTLWTSGGQRRIPGVASYGTPREWARLLLRLEQGRLVDAWSSLEMKRYLYMTRKRYRFAYAPELAGAAVYFKSGSLYRCAPEPGFTCKKYHGNVENLMNSIAIVETPAGGGEGARRYLVALMSDVLRKNSAWDHSRLAAAIDQTVRTRAGSAVRDEGSAQDLREVGQGE